MGNYFEDAIANNQPIVPPTPMPPIQPPPVQASVAPVVQPNGFVGLPVRTVGDRIFLLRGGKKYWVMNPEAYAKLGFKFGDEVRIDEQTLAVLPEGEPLR